MNLSMRLPFFPLFLFVVPLVLLSCARLEEPTHYPTLSEPVRAVLLQLPEADVQQRVDLRIAPELEQQLAALRTEQIRELIDYIVIGDVNQDRRPRSAIHALVLLARPPAPALRRAQLAGAIGDAVADGRVSRVTREFLVGQLRFLGGREAVDVLARALQDGELAEPAIVALLEMEEGLIGEHERLETLQTAYRRSHGSRRATLLRALGRLGDRSLLREFRQDAESTNIEIREAALDAIAAAGDPADGSRLLHALARATPATRLQAENRYVIFIDRIGRDDPEAGINLSREFFRRAYLDQRGQAAAGALRVLADLQGPDALDQIGAALQSHDPDLRAAALEIAARMPGQDVTRYWVEIVNNLEEAELRATILHLLAARGDRLALACVERSQRDPDPAVRQAAAHAASRLHGETAIALVDQAGATEIPITQPDLKQTLSARLQTEPDPERRTVVLLDELARATQPGEKGTILGLLAREGGDAALSAVRGALIDPDPAVREAATRALAEWPDARPTPDLLAVARGEDEERLRLIALRGAVRLVDRDARLPAASKLAWYDEGMRIAWRAEERHQILASMQQVKDLAALRRTAQWLDDPATATQAATAALRIAAELSPSERAEARQTLERIARMEDPELRREALRLQGR